MPLLLKTPDTKGNDTIQIESYTMYSINSEDDIRLSIVYSVGITLAGSYTEKSSRRRADFLGGNIPAKMMAPLAGDTIYAATKKALYELLQEQNYVGAGAIV